MNWTRVLEFVRRRERALLCVALLLAVGLTRVITEWRGGVRAGGLRPVAARVEMRGIELLDTRGQIWQLQDRRGTVVLINLWTTWCGPCAEETPGLVRVAQAMRDKGVEVLGLSLDAGGATAENAVKVEAFRRRYGVGYTLAFPQAGSQLSSQVNEVPTTILVDREGKVAKTYVGPVREEVFREDLEAVLRGG